jgi:hypothetical protein
LGDGGGEHAPRREAPARATSSPQETTMSKKNRAPAPVLAPEPEIEITLADLPIDAEVQEEIEKKGSVVKSTYKKKYAARAAAQGGTKVAQRSCWDWLAQELASECLEGTKINIDRFLAILEANAVDHSRWTNRSKGWEGRLRMTGRLALQKVVAAQGHLKTAEGAELEAPAEWVAKFTN